MRAQVLAPALKLVVVRCAGQTLARPFFFGLH